MPGKPRDLIGKKFGRLTVIKLTDKRFHSYAIWECLCDCGNLRSVSSQGLISGHTKSCGCLGSERIENLLGKRFGRLLVISLTKDRVNGNKSAKWLCKCDCGNFHIVSANALKKGTTVSCGCFHKEMVSSMFSKGRGEAGFNRIYRRYKESALKRKLEFNLNESEFKQIISGHNCYYCGSDDFIVSKSRNCDVRNINGDFHYMGIDRIDNTKGYTLDNCVPCCKLCNYMKRAMSFNDFIDHIRKIYDFTRELETEELV